MRKVLLAFAVSGFLLVPVNPARAEDESKAVIEKAIKAYGGEEKLARLQKVRLKGKGTLEIQGMSIDFTADSLVQHPGQMKNEIQIEVQGQKVSVLQVVNGDKGWMQVMGKTMLLEGDPLTELKAGMHASTVGRLLPLRDKAFTLAPLGEVEVNGKKAVGVKVSSKGQKDIELYFDKESGLVVKTARRSLDPANMMEVLQESFASVYKDFNGLKYPTKLLIHQDGKKYMEMEVTEFIPVDKVDDSEFAKP